MRVVECVPNISEGRDRAVIDAVAGVIHQVEGCELLDVDPGAATNRTVITFVGTPETVVEGAFQLVKKAQELIDMRHHSGEHPRFGATDVCPFVPVSGVDMDDCVELAHRLGQRLGEELGISGYFYENAARTPERQNLSVVRSGEYEALEKKLSDPKWKPDFGPATFDPKFGVVAVGAREFLIAYNVNVNTADKRLPHEIALRVREQGRAKRDENWQIVRDENGKPLKVPGRLKNVKGIGWTIEEFGTAQVSMNLTNFRETPVHVVFDACEEEARDLGVRVTGSEIVGLVPLQAMLDAGRHYLQKMNKSAGVPEKDLVDTAIRSLGLRDVTDFDPQEKIIEYRLRREEGLRTLSIRDFADELSSESPAPGGGSVAALCGSMAAALAAMVPNLSVIWRDPAEARDTMSAIAEEAQQHKDWFVRAIDADTDAFTRVIEANRLPAGTPEEKAAKERALREANRGATLVPLDVLERTLPVFDLARQAAEKGNPNSLSDAGVAGLCALAGAEAAFYNVLINLNGIEGDDAWVSETRERADAALGTAEEKASSLRTLVRERLGA
ncbi:MAG TPA: glutamate formimidoyltransferase [Candidatus Krumholzibacteria bacterium]|nr:glutamate formimidoyltransferase [Candidatus Krumholzibacteria bacterium]